MVEPRVIPRSEHSLSRSDVDPDALKVRFRLAHVKFGNKVIEVATFRRQVQPGEEIVADGVPAPDHHHGHSSDATGEHATVGLPVDDSRDRGPLTSKWEEAASRAARDEAQLIHRDNT